MIPKPSRFDALVVKDQRRITRAQAKRQRRENRVIASVAAEDKAQYIFEDFQKLAEKYSSRPCRPAAHAAALTRAG